MRAPRRPAAPAAPAAPGPVQRMPLGTLALLAAAVLAAVTTEVLPVGLLPQLSAAFGVGEERIGWWMSAYAVVVAAGAVPVTALLARWPRRRALLVLLLTYALSNAVILAAGSYWVALAARLLGGLAHAGLFSVAVATAVAVAPAGRSVRAVAVVNAGVTLALALGVPLGTALGAAAGWRWAFAATTALLVVLAALTALVLPRDRPAGAPGAGAGATTGVLRALRGRALLLVAATTAVLTTGHYSAYTYVTPLLREAGVGGGAVSAVLLGYGAASVIGLLVSGACADRSPVAALRTAVAWIALCLLALALSTTSGAATAAVVVAWGAAFGALPTLLQTAALRASTAPEAAPAVVNATFNVGIATGAWLGGRLLVQGSPAVLALASAALVLVALATTLRRAPRTG